MSHSELQRILRRLDAMAEDTHGDIQQRTFSAYGIQICTVTYRQSTGEFELEQFQPAAYMTFDNLDLTAIEVYRCLYDFKNSF